MIAFGRMVVHDIENDFDAGTVQRLDHGFELIDAEFRMRPRSVIQAQKSRWCYSPNSWSEPLSLQVHVIDEGMNGEQFDGCDAQSLQIIDDWPCRQRSIGALVMRLEPSDGAW